MRGVFPRCHGRWLSTVVPVVVVGVRHLTVWAVKSFCEVMMESPVGDGGLDMLPLDVGLLCAKMQRQVLDGFGINVVGTRQSRTNATHVCV